MQVQTQKLKQDDYQNMSYEQDQNLNVNVEKYKRKQFQNFEATSKQLIELSELHKDMATEQTNNIDQFNKKFDNTKTVIKETEKEIEYIKKETTINYSKILCYVAVIVCIFIALLSLKNLGGV